MTTLVRRNCSSGQPKIAIFEAIFESVQFCSHGLCFSGYSSKANFVQVGLVLTTKKTRSSLQQHQNDNIGDKRLEGEEDLTSLRKEVADLQEVSQISMVHLDSMNLNMYLEIRKYQGPPRTGTNVIRIHKERM